MLKGRDGGISGPGALWMRWTIEKRDECSGIISWSLFMPCICMRAPGYSPSEFSKFPKSPCKLDKIHVPTRQDETVQEGTLPLRA